jgi:hypothetical protein
VCTVGKVVDVREGVVQALGFGGRELQMSCKLVAPNVKAELCMTLEQVDGVEHVVGETELGSNVEMS